MSAMKSGSVRRALDIVGQAMRAASAASGGIAAMIRAAAPLFLVSKDVGYRWLDASMVAWRDLPGCCRFVLAQPPLPLQPLDDPEGPVQQREAAARGSSLFA